MVPILHEKVKRKFFFHLLIVLLLDPDPIRIHHNLAPNIRNYYLKYAEDMVPVLHEEDLGLVHDEDLDGVEKVVVALLLPLRACID
jgi:hypothetical protein